MTVVYLSREELVARARSLVPKLRARGREISELRRLPDDIMREIVDAGLMRRLKPQRYGGPEVGLDIVYDVTRELAKGDGSTAWTYVVITTHDVLLGHFPDHVQRAYWDSELPQTAASFVPFGTALPADGGFSLSGKWSYLSGVDFAGWVILGANLARDGSGAPRQHFFLVPISQVEIVDDWYAMGLAGTGSKSVILQDVFVPNDRVLLTEAVLRTGDTPGARVHPGSTYKFPALMFLDFALTSPATGIAQGAYESIISDLRPRMEQPDNALRQRLPAIQMRIARASALIRASDLVYTQALRETLAQLNSGKALTIEQRACNRRDTTHSICLAQEAMKTLFAIVGARGLNTESIVQRAMRDIDATSVHPANGLDPAWLSYGAVALGGTPTDPF